MGVVVVTGGFDDLRSRHIRLFHEASRLGPLHVLLWSDEAIAAVTGQPAKFPAPERLYFLQAVRYVERVTLVEDPSPDRLPPLDGPPPEVWVVPEPDSRQEAFCRSRGLDYRLLSAAELAGYPLPEESETVDSDRPKVIVTGCFDWLHSGHVRFFEEASEYGDLYVVVGHDANVRLLKGEGHPLFGQDERRYMVQAIRHVTQALISSGEGWMDAAPEIARIKPDIYLVNEDGDKPEKRAFCDEHGLEYVVLRREPKEGLPRRESTELRGF